MVFWGYASSRAFKQPACVANKATKHFNSTQAVNGVCT